MPKTLNFALEIVTFDKDLLNLTKDDDDNDRFSLICNQCHFKMFFMLTFPHILSSTSRFKPMEQYTFRLDNDVCNESVSFYRFCREFV